LAKAYVRVTADRYASPGGAACHPEPVEGKGVPPPVEAASDLSS